MKNHHHARSLELHKALPQFGLCSTGDGGVFFKLALVPERLTHVYPGCEVAYKLKILSNPTFKM